MKNEIRLQTYSEFREEQFFDWKKALSAPNFKNLTPNYIQDLIVKSDNWVACACRNQCSKIPRYKSGSSKGGHKDMYLFGLGCKFTRQIRAIRTIQIVSPLKDRKKLIEIARKDALMILEKIEHKSFLIILEMT